MSLKIVALVIAGLVAQSSAFVVKTLHTDGPTVPGFTYTAEKNTEHDKLSLTTPEGHLFSYPSYLNYSAWEFSTAAGAPQIKQNTSLPFLSATYKVQYSVGDVSGSGEIRANFGNATFNLTFVAHDDDKTCTLETKVSSPEMDVYLDMRELDENEFQAPSVLKAVESTVAKAVVDALAPLLTELTVKALPGSVDTADLCKKIWSANEKNFPEPDF